MNNQEIFDTVYAHLVKQGKPAMGRGSCMYRASDGCKCAVGVLISDDAYEPHLENCGASNIDVLTALSRSGVNATGNTIRLLCDLQSAHDASSSWSGDDGFVAHYRMGLIADRFGLEFKSLEKAS